MEAHRYNYYDILEVSPHCAQHEVTAAYEKAKLTYSGENPAIYTIFSDEEARELLKLVEEAYSVLGNKTLRGLYDEKLAQAGIRKEDLTFDALKNQSKIFQEIPKKTVIEKIDFTPNAAMEKEIQDATVIDGEFLRRVREYKKVSLERLSETTKISAYYITALEKMEAANLPAAVFVRGYVGQVSKVLGLDDKKACDSYMKIFKENLGKK